MGSGCSSCQAENQCILSDTISLHQKFKSDQIQQNAELEPQIQFQQCPNKQYSGDQHPELELKSQDDMILDISDEFFASINLQEKLDEENIKDSQCEEFWSQQTIISNLSSFSSDFCKHQTVNIYSFKNNQNGKQKINNTPKNSFQFNKNYLDKKKKKLQKKYSKFEQQYRIQVKFNYREIDNIETRLIRNFKITFHAIMLSTHKQNIYKKSSVILIK